MRLISCHIANFGGLSDYDCAFEPELTVVEEPNGFGKTTLAEFIRAMLYGFPRAGRDIEKNPRKKYMPWQGGEFGGSLVFEHEGVQYRVERSFGARPSSDTFALYDLRTNKKSGRFGKDIGLEIFQLDSDSFERSTYLPQLHSGISSLSTDSIQAKLGDLVQDTNDVNNYESAREALQKARSSLIPYRGSGGAVAKAQSEVSAREDEIASARPKVEELSFKRSELSRQRKLLGEKKKAREEIQKEISLASQAEGNRAVAQRYEELCNAYQEILDKKEELDARYPKGVPPAERVDDALAAAKKMEELKAQIGPSQEYLDAKSRCEGEKAFESGVPSEDDFEHYNQLASSCASARDELQRAGLDPEEEGNLAQLKKVFSSGVPSDEEIARHKDLLERANRLREENQGITAAAAAPVISENPAPKKSNAYLVTLVLGIIFVGAGGALLFMGHGTPGGILAGAGILFLIATVYLRLKDMVNHAVTESVQTGPSMSERDRQKLRENDEEIHRLESEAEAFAARYSSGAGTLSDRIQKIQNMAAEYRRLGEKAEKLSGRRQELEEAISELSRQIESFLAPYFDSVSPDAFASQLRSLEVRANAYEKDMELVAMHDRLAGDAEQPIRECRDVIDSLAAEYGIQGDLSAEALREMKSDSLLQSDLGERLDAARKKKDDYFREKEDILSAGAPDVDADRTELEGDAKRTERDIDAISHQIMTLEGDVGRLQEAVDRIPEIEDERDEWKGRLEEGRESARLLDDAIRYLGEAKESLSTSYLPEIQRAFAGYLEQLSGEDAGQAAIDTKLDVTMDRQGKYREMGYFSAGQAESVMLCMRFALVDALFKGEGAFLILDDPFVNLDDERVAAATSLLRRIAKSHQVLYLTCHSSRRIG